MKRLVFAISLALIITQLTLPPTFGAKKEGANCVKLNQTTIYAGFRYTCVKSGKKLLWGKGIAVPKQPQTSKTTPTPIPSTTPARKSPIAPLSGLDQVASRYSDISTLAFRASDANIRSFGTDSAKINLLVGPNSQDLAPRDYLAVHNVQKLFHGGDLPPTVDLFYYTSGDHDWAIKEMMGLLLRPEYVNSDDGPKTAIDGTAVVALKYTGVPTEYVTSGALEAHEFFHTVQQRQFSNSKFHVWTMPRWWIEGGGRFVENLQLNNYDEKMYLIMARNRELEQFDATYFADFLDTTTVPTAGDAWANSYKYSDAVVYGVGAKIEEMLVAFKGPNTLIDFMDEVSLSGDFISSFKLTYGIAWSDFVPLAAASIYQSTRLA